MPLIYPLKLPWTYQALIFSEFVRSIILSQISMIWEEFRRFNCIRSQDCERMKPEIIVIVLSYQPRANVWYGVYELGWIHLQTITPCKIAVILSHFKSSEYSKDLTNSKLKTFTKLLSKLGIIFLHFLALIFNLISSFHVQSYFFHVAHGQIMWKSMGEVVYKCIQIQNGLLYKSYNVPKIPKQVEFLKSVV